MPVAYYHISVGLFDTCPLFLIRLPWVYLTIVRYPLSDFCVFGTCHLPNTRFMYLTHVRLLLPELPVYLLHIRFLLPDFGVFI